jgi:uncharacterized protein (DUF433 family)
MKPSVIVVDPEIMSGAPCFDGTRVTVKSLFDYLDGGHLLAEAKAHVGLHSRDVADRAPFLA